MNNNKQTSKQKIRFIVNPIAGVRNKVNVPDMIRSTINKQQFDYEIVFTEHAGHAIDITKDAIAKGFDIVVAVGGDGSINEVASQLVNTEVILAIIPLGSGNGLATKLALPFNQRAAIQVINDGFVSNMDVGVFNDKYFFSVVGTGFEAQVINHFSKTKGRGFKEYTWVTIQEFFKYRPFDFRLEAHGEVLEGKVFSLSVGNSGEFGYNIGLTPQSDLNDGLLEVCFVRHFSFFFLTYMFFLMIFKKMHWSKKVRIVRASKLKITAPAPTFLQADGDAEEHVSEVNVSVIKSGIKVITPRPQLVTKA